MQRLLAAIIGAVLKKINTICETNVKPLQKKMYLPEGVGCLPRKKPYGETVWGQTFGDPDGFTNGKQVLKMGGFDLCADRSGKRSNSATPVISKHGKADLRYALYQAAIISSLNDKDFIVYHTNKIRGREREKGIGTKKRGTLAAKLLIIAWALTKKKEPFDPKHLNHGDSKA